MELPLPDVPVCIWIHRDEGLKQPEGRQLQPPQCDNRILALECFFGDKGGTKILVTDGNPKNLHIGLVRFLNVQWEHIKTMSAKHLTLRQVDDNTQSRAFLLEQSQYPAYGRPWASHSPIIQVPGMERNVRAGTVSCYFYY